MRFTSNLLFVDIAISLLNELALRSGIMETVDYKRNKNQQKIFIKKQNIYRHIFCLYKLEDIFAPKNAKRIYVVRVINCISLAISTIFYFSPYADKVITCFFIAKTVLIIFEIFYWIIYLPQKKKGKGVDFSRVNKP